MSGANKVDIAGTWVNTVSCRASVFKFRIRNYPPLRAQHLPLAGQSPPAVVEISAGYCFRERGT